ncbi:MAG: HAMP domain-containing histidine kinase [Acidimicrobiales bacterium]|jgi:signal transduction histidine kinase|nr:HAMP domain-containing histidine kinase [Acidimicrobiales bacterium]
MSTAGLSRLWSSARARVLIGALALLAATIAVSILVDRAVLVARLDDRLDAELVQEIDEFRRLVGEVDPATGAPFGSDLEAIADAFLARNVPGEDEVFLAIVDGAPYGRSADAPYPIEDLTPLVDTWATTASPQLRTDDTPAGALRSLAVPVVTGDGESRGAFVVARFPAGERAEIDDAVRVAAVVGAAAFVVAALAAWAIAGRVLSPLRNLATAAGEIDERDLSHRIDVEGSGELADLGQRFNAMLDRVEGAFDTQRAFLDDAGHELRTPITVLRGHLELVEPGAPLPADTRALLLDELDRMSRIVEDLVTIAKAERPDFVTPAPVDVADLTLDIAEKARALAPRDWQVAADAVLVADLDRQRIVQAWMNLARNAAQHTAEGDTITVFGRERDGALELGIADTGEGVADADRARVFERFGRGASARRTSADGAGLGLAIADAIAVAHGGSIRLDDTPGGGATFTIELPLDTEPTPTEPEDAWPAS